MLGVLTMIRHLAGICVVVIMGAVLMGCRTPQEQPDGISFPTVLIVAYEGISAPGPDGRGYGYHLFPSSHELVLNRYFGTAQVVSKNDSKHVVVQLLPSFKPAAQAFMKASPDNIVTYVQEISGHRSKYLNHMSDPSTLRQILIPLGKKGRTPD